MGSGSGWLLVLRGGFYSESESCRRCKCVFFLFFVCVTEIMSLITSYRPIAVLSQAQWWPKLTCVQSLVSYFRRRSVSSWNSYGENAFCLLYLACPCPKDVLGAVLLSQVAVFSHTRFPFFPCLGSQYGNIIILSDVIILGDGKIVLPNTCPY